MSTAEPQSSAQPAPDEHPIEEIEKDFSDGSSNHASDDPEKDATPAAAAAPAAVGNVLKKIKSAASANDIDSVPNGGLRAWLQVMGAFSLFFNTWGILNTFGVYQTYYEQQHLATSSNISWLGSIQAFLLLLVGALTGPVYDAGYFRTLLFTGSFLVVFGHMMLSLVNAYWQAVLAQALIIGLGCGCLFVPSVAILSTYFTTRISTAIGIAASGSSLGGVIYPIMFYKLVPEVGFPWAVRIIGFMALGLLAIPCTVMKMRVKPPAKRKLFSIEPFKEVPYSLFCVAGFIGFMGLYEFFFYISYFGLESGFMNESLAFYLIPILNAASTFGRILPNLVADKIGPNNLMVPASLFSSIMAYLVLACTNTAGVVVLTALFGFFSGSFVSIPPSIIVLLTPPNKRHMIGTRLGLFLTCSSFGVLLGGPVSGYILGSELDFHSTFVFGGTMLMGGFVFFFLTRMFAAKWKVVVKI